ncbi:RNA 2',3'-cyclic phosphodiesterase [Falsibacillus pallidus]|uniref:RNA 2',3'-cyclic phosphodiesterase n=1 Tax=Falsibacillus pallidus TaxID=493781 RepID=UPI003D96DBAF
MTKPHYFIAVSLPKEVKQFLKQWCQENKNVFPFKKWVHWEDYHLTLAFLGEVPDRELLKVKENVSKAIAGFQHLPTSASDLGVFGNPDAPRVFWAGINVPEKLYKLQDAVKEAVESTGLQVDKKPFNPHITLARKWEGHEMFSSDELRKASEAKLDKPSFSISEINLYQTHLDRIPKYEAIETWFLKETAEGEK